MNQVLALDFDGVLCDASAECILVTWNGFHEKSLEDFSDAGLEAIPSAFSERFLACRGFARHLAHFSVSLLDPLPPIPNQQVFETLYQSLSPEAIEQFTRRVLAYRAQAREQKHACWLSYHHLYPGIAEFLQSVTSPAYIVTAKDAPSVVAILEHAGVSFAEDHIYGEQQEKKNALRAIQQREQVAATKVHLFDDHLSNVLAARQAGYSATWATWGYHTPDHVARAMAEGVPSLSLERFLQPA